MKPIEALTHSPVQKSFSTKYKTAIIAGLLIYFFSISVWIAKPGPLKTSLLSLVTPLSTPLSIFQSWANANTREANYHETAVITFQDGSLKLYEFPRLQKLRYFKRFRQAKYRTIFSENMPWADCLDFLPDLSRFLACANWQEDNQPTMISLIHNWCYIPPPNPQSWVERKNLPEHTNQTTYFVYACQTKETK